MPRPYTPIFLDLRYLETADAEFDFCFCHQSLSQMTLVYSVKFDCEENTSLTMQNLKTIILIGKAILY